MKIWRFSSKISSNWLLVVLLLQLKKSRKIIKNLKKNDILKRKLSHYWQNKRDLSKNLVNFGWKWKFSIKNEMNLPRKTPFIRKIIRKLSIFLEDLIKLNFDRWIVLYKNRILCEIFGNLTFFVKSFIRLIMDRSAFYIEIKSRKILKN